MYLEYRRRTGEIVGIFHGYQVEERELFPLIHAVSTGSYIRDDRPGAITAGAGDAVVVAMNRQVSDVDYLGEQTSGSFGTRNAGKESKKKRRGGRREVRNCQGRVVGGIVSDVWSRAASDVITPELLS